MYSKNEPQNELTLIAEPYAHKSASTPIQRTIHEPYNKICRQIDRYAFELRKGHYRKLAQCRDVLTEYAFDQFPREEQLMLHYSYNRKWTQSHISDHRAFWGLLDQLCHSTLNASETLDVLKHWLIHHHDSHDKLFIASFHQPSCKIIQTSMSPDVAA